MTPQEILKAVGAHLEVKEGKLYCSDRSKLTSGMTKGIKEHKAELIALLDPTPIPKLKAHIWRQLIELGIPDIVELPDDRLELNAFCWKLTQRLKAELNRRSAEDNREFPQVRMYPKPKGWDGNTRPVYANIHAGMKGD